MPKPSNQVLLSTAVAAAEAGASVLRERFAHPRQVSYKGRIDLVTDADVAAEAAIIAVLRQTFPGHAIAAEESQAQFSPIAGPQGDDDGYRWIIDPLDGTTNYAHAIPHFSVSVACEWQGKPLAGVVIDPMRRECFAAAAGEGASLNGEPVVVSHVADIERAVLATGFPTSVQQRAEELVPLFQAFLVRAQAVRRFGSAALDLAWVACGRYDGFFERGLKVWDVAAGRLLVEEADGVVSSLDGSPFDASAGQILAASRVLHPQLATVAQNLR